MPSICGPNAAQLVVYETGLRVWCGSRLCVYPITCIAITSVEYYSRRLEMFRIHSSNQVWGDSGGVRRLSLPLRQNSRKESHPLQHVGGKGVIGLPVERSE